MSTILNALNKIAFLVAPIFYKLLFMSIAAFCIGSVIMLIRRFVDGKISPTWKYIMWILVLVALVVPYRPQSELALLNNVQKVQEISFRDEYDQIKMEQHNFFEIDEPTTDQQVEFKEIEKTMQAIYLKSLIFDVAIPLLWFFGLISIAIFMVISFVRLSLMLHRHQYEISESYYVLLEKCKAKLDMRSKVKIVLQDYMGSPALVGIVRPKIILPPFVKEISDENIEYIMLHELSHYKRFDMLLNYLLLLLQVVYWFNPLVWIMFKFIRQDVELANDAYVLHHIGNEKTKEYSQSLVEVLRQYNKISFGPKFLCMVDGKDNIERRIKMIKLGEVFKKHRLVIAAMSLVIIGLVSTLFLTQSKYNSIPIMEAISNINSVELTLGTYSWNFGKEQVQVDSINPIDFEYAEVLKFQNESEVSEPFPIRCKSGEKFSVQSVNITPLDAKIETDVEYTIDGNNILIPSPRVVGGFVYTIGLTFENGTVYYSFKVVNGQKLQAFKGLELYIWKNKLFAGNDDIYFTLLGGTNRNKEYSEIYDMNAATTDINVIGEKLKQYDDGLYLQIYQMNETDFTKEQMMDFSDELIKFMPSNYSSGIGTFTAELYPQIKSKK